MYKLYAIYWIASNTKFILPVISPCGTLFLMILLTKSNVARPHGHRGQAESSENTILPSNN